MDERGLKPGSEKGAYAALKAPLFHGLLAFVAAKRNR